MAIRDTDGHVITSAPPITLTNAANTKTQTIQIDCENGYSLRGTVVGDVTVEARHGTSGGYTDIETTPIALATWDGSLETFQVRFTASASISSDLRVSYQLAVSK